MSKGGITSPKNTFVGISVFYYFLIIIRGNIINPQMSWRETGRLENASCNDCGVGSGGWQDVSPL